MDLPEKEEGNDGIEDVFDRSEIGRSDRFDEARAEKQAKSCNEYRNKSAYAPVARGKSGVPSRPSRMLAVTGLPGVARLRSIGRAVHAHAARPWNPDIQGRVNVKAFCA